MSIVISYNKSADDLFIRSLYDRLSAEILHELHSPESVTPSPWSSVSVVAAGITACWDSPIDGVPVTMAHMNNALIVPIISYGSLSLLSTLFSSSTSSLPSDDSARQLLMEWELGLILSDLSIPACRLMPIFLMTTSDPLSSMIQKLSSGVCLNSKSQLRSILSILGVTLPSSYEAEFLMRSVQMIVLRLFELYGCHVTERQPTFPHLTTLARAVITEYNSCHDTPHYKKPVNIINEVIYGDYSSFLSATRLLNAFYYVSGASRYSCVQEVLCSLDPVIRDILQRHESRGETVMIMFCGSTFDPLQKTPDMCTIVKYLNSYYNISIAAVLDSAYEGMALAVAQRSHCDLIFIHRSDYSRNGLFQGGYNDSENKSLVGASRVVLSDSVVNSGYQGSRFGRFLAGYITIGGGFVSCDELDYCSSRGIPFLFIPNGSSPDEAKQWMEIYKYKLNSWNVAKQNFLISRDRPNKERVCSSARDCITFNLKDYFPQ